MKNWLLILLIVVASGTAGIVSGLIINRERLHDLVECKQQLHESEALIYSLSNNTD